MPIDPNVQSTFDPSLKISEVGDQLTSLGQKYAGGGSLTGSDVDHLLKSGEYDSIQQVRNGGPRPQNMDSMSPISRRAINSELTNRTLSTIQARRDAQREMRHAARNGSIGGSRGGGAGRSDIFRKPGGGFVRAGDPGFLDAVSAYETATGKRYSRVALRRHERLSGQTHTPSPAQAVTPPPASGPPQFGPSVPQYPTAPMPPAPQPSPYGTPGPVQVPRMAPNQGSTGMTVRDTGPEPANAVVEAVTQGQNSARAGGDPSIDRILEAVLGRIGSNPSKVTTFRDDSIKMAPLNPNGSVKLP